VTHLQPLLFTLSTAFDVLAADGTHASFVVCIPPYDFGIVQVEGIAVLVPLAALGETHESRLRSEEGVTMLVDGRIGGEGGGDGEGAVESRERGRDLDAWGEGSVGCILGEGGSSDAADGFARRVGGILRGRRLGPLVRRLSWRPRVRALGRSTTLDAR
jgi:hypothetical protein